MKKILSMLMILVLLLGAVSCSSERTIKVDGVNQSLPYYGLGSSDTEREEGIDYGLSVWNTIVGIIFIETIVVPIYIFGFNCMKPIKEIK